MEMTAGTCFSVEDATLAVLACANPILLALLNHEGVMLQLMTGLTLQNYEVVQ